MLDLAERMDDEATADASRDCLVNLAPDWAIAPTEDEWTVAS